MAPPSALPIDSLYEILIHLPAKDLCRLRCVCQAWRSLLSDPHFISTHAARHPEPLIIISNILPCRSGCVFCDIMDISGRVVKRVYSTGDGMGPEQVMCMHLDHIIIAKRSCMSCKLINLATGAAHVLPERLAAEHAAYDKGFLEYQVSTALGLVPSTAEYKVLRMVQFWLHGYPSEELCEIFTLDGSSQAHWRGKQAPPYHVDELSNRNSVVIDGVVYFLLGEFYLSATKGLVGSFDLETEKWSASIQGPFRRPSYGGIVIAALGGCLVLGSRTACSSMDSPSMDLWFLRDFGKGLWVKQHSIKISVLHAQHIWQPVLVLNDRRIANHIGSWAFVKIRNRDIDKDDYKGAVGNHSVAVAGLYGGSLLSLENGAS